MNETLKNFLERTTFVGTLARRRRRKRLERKYSEWKKNGSVLPMPHLGKQRILAEYAEKFSPTVFIETGTYKGDMVYAILNQFEEIFSEVKDDIIKIYSNNLHNEQHHGKRFHAAEL